jgi:hypoxanthine phosphoribosyltransferase
LARADSALLDGARRAAAARASIRLRPGGVRPLRRMVNERGAMVVVVDDIITTGSTLTAVSERLAEADVPVSAAAVLAATAWRGGGTGRTPVVPPDGARWAIHRESVLRTRDDGRASAS